MVVTPSARLEGATPVRTGMGLRTATVTDPGAVPGWPLAVAVMVTELGVGTTAGAV